MPLLTDQAIALARSLTVGQVQLLRARRGLTQRMLSEMPDDVLRKLLGRLRFHDLPRMRAQFRYQQSSDQRGVVPAGGLFRAIADKNASLRPLGALIAGLRIGARPAPVPGGAALPPTAGLDPGHTGWTALGPGNIGGRIRSIVIDPRDSKRLWAGSVGGGVWQSRDSGASWAPVDDLLANLAVSCMAIDRSNPNVLYAGTGEGFFNVDAIRGGGIFQTLDSVSWKQLPATSGDDFRAVNRIAVAADGSYVLAATQDGVFRSSDAARQTWTRVLSGDIAYVACHPKDASRAIAADLQSGQAYVSIEAGTTWAGAIHAGTWSNRVELAYAAADPSIVYASVNVNGGEVWRSDDGGRSYQRRANLTADGQPVGYLGTQGWYGNCVWAGDRTNPNLVIVGGVNLWRSVDAGDTLIDISTWWDARSCHADHHQIVADPNYDGTANKVVYFGNDGGIYRTNDASTVGNDANLPRVSGWLRLDNSFGVTQFYGGAGNAASGTIIGGAQDNGTLTFTPANGSQKWGTMFGGDGGWCASDPTDPELFYGEYVYLNICRSTDGGASADYISGQFWDGQQWTFKPVPFQIPDAVTQDALFIAPFVLDPNEPNRILAGGLSLWRTNDAKTANTDATGPAWASIKDSAGSHTSAIAIAVGNSDLVWVGHEDGQIFMTASGTSDRPVWQRMDNAGPNGLNVGRYCTRLCIDPHDSDTLYALFSGYVAGNIWKTSDGGQNWTDIGGSLPSVPVRAIAIHPNNNSLLYLGTDVGIYASEDSGANWSAANEGPTNCSVDDLFWIGTKLVAATHGRGMFSIDLAHAAH
jgi:photosystem II stability/assembly factor-like uncharacterized protein